MAAMRAMPKWTKAPEQLVALFEDAIRPLPDVEPRRMFGYPAAFSGGHMFASLFQDHLILRLPEPGRAAFMREHGAGLFEPVPGRPMREYVAAPQAVLQSRATLDRWLREARAYAASLPPKAGKARQREGKAGPAKRSRRRSR